VLPASAMRKSNEAAWTSEESAFVASPTNPIPYGSSCRGEERSSPRCSGGGHSEDNDSPRYAGAWGTPPAITAPTGATRVDIAHDARTDGCIVRSLSTLEVSGESLWRNGWLCAPGAAKYPRLVRLQAIVDRFRRIRGARADPFPAPPRQFFTSSLRSATGADATPIAVHRTDRTRTHRTEGVPEGGESSWTLLSGVRTGVPPRTT